MNLFHLFLSGAVIGGACIFAAPEEVVRDGWAYTLESSDEIRRAPANVEKPTLVTGTDLVALPYDGYTIVKKGAVYHYIELDRIEPDSESQLRRESTSVFALYAFKGHEDPKLLWQMKGRLWTIWNDESEIWLDGQLSIRFMGQNVVQFQGGPIDSVNFSPSLPVQP